MTIELTQRHNVEAFIGNHIECLEEILDERAQQYSRVQREKESYDFGQNLTPERLSELAGEVIKDTKQFLEINDAPPIYLSMFHLPRDLKHSLKVALGVSTLTTLVQSFDEGFTQKDLQLGISLGLLFGIATFLVNYRNHFNSCFDGSRTMRICEKKEVNGAGTVAHEYAHHLQNALTDLKVRGIRKNPIVEGHARGLEGAVSNVFAERYDNPAYSFDHTERTARELKDAYLFICGERGISPRESLAKLPIPKLRGFIYKHLGHHYSIGVAAMSIAEAQHGDKVYRDVMRNDFSFLEN